MSKEIVNKIKAAEQEAARIRAEAETAAREIKAAAEADAERRVEAEREKGEAALAAVKAEQGELARRAVEDGRKAGAYESARETSVALDNLPAAVDYIIGGLMK